MRKRGETTRKNVYNEEAGVQILFLAGYLCRADSKIALDCIRTTERSRGQLNEINRSLMEMEWTHETTMDARCPRN